MANTEQFKIIQDFDNKRANAFASLFIASMFGLFGLLGVMVRIHDSPSFFNGSAIYFLLSSYILVWIFGLYSLLNFFFYATVAQLAETQITGETRNNLIRNVIDEWAWIPRTFANFKVQIKKAVASEGKKVAGPSKFIWFRVHKETIFVVLYILIGLLPLFAL
jgi:hypothetical protein